MSAIILTPISPHTLSVRPLVLPDSSRIRVLVQADGKDAVLTLDGQEWHELAGGDEIEVTKSRHHAAILKVEDKASSRRCAASSTGERAASDGAAERRRRV